MTRPCQLSKHLPDLILSFLIGFGVTFAANAAPMLVTELAYPLYRAQLTALYNSLWYSGNIV